MVPGKSSAHLRERKLSLHQSFTFSIDYRGLTDALERSPLFGVEPIGRGRRARWVRRTPEDDPLHFPMGLVSLNESGLLLESFSDEWLKVLRNRIEELGPWRATIDEMRVLDIVDAVQRPEVLLQPLHEMAGLELRPRDVAILYLTMAWPFMEREDLSGRTPSRAIRTGRGRTALEKAIPGVPDELRRIIPDFPEFEKNELQRLLLPAEPQPVSSPAPESAPGIDAPRRP